MLSSLSTMDRRTVSQKAAVWLFALLSVLGLGMVAGSQEADLLAAQETAVEQQLQDPEVMSNLLAEEGENGLAQSTSGEVLASTDVEQDLSDQLTQVDTSDDSDNSCNVGSEDAADYLPATRWGGLNGLEYYSSTSLINPISMTAVMSAMASFMFSAASVMWSLLFWLMDFGITFHPLCTTATTINTIVADVGQIMLWFLVPLLVFWIWKNVKLVTQGKFGTFLKKFIVLLLSGGLLWAITAQSEEARDAGSDNAEVLNHVGTVPWAANSLMNGFSAAYSGVAGITDQLATNEESGVGTQLRAFRDHLPPGTEDVGVNDYLTCYNYVYGDVGTNNYGTGNPGLYGLHQDAVSDLTGSQFQAQFMGQASRMWETAYLSQWMRAQFGSNNMYASSAACRMLEMRTPESEQSKAETFVAAQAADQVGWDEDDVLDSGLIYMMHPNMSGYQIPTGIAWASCRYTDTAGVTGWTMSHGVNGSAGSSGAQGRQQLACGRSWPDIENDSVWGALAEFVTNAPGIAELREIVGTFNEDWGDWPDTGPPLPFYQQNASGFEDGHDSTTYAAQYNRDNADGILPRAPVVVGLTMEYHQQEYSFHPRDMLENLLDDGGTIYMPVNGSDTAANYGNPNDAAYNNFLADTSGENWFTRNETSGLAVIVAALYLWALGPLAVGLVIAGFMLIVMLMMVPFAILLAMFGVQGGWKLLKMTAATTGTLFIFGLLLSFLTVIMGVFASIIASITDDGFVRAIALAVVPIAALLILRKLLASMGLGNITSLSGSLGFASAAAAKAAGQDSGGITKAFQAPGNAVKSGFRKAGKAAGAFNTARTNPNSNVSNGMNWFANSRAGDAVAGAASGLRHGKGIKGRLGAAKEGFQAGKGGHNQSKASRALAAQSSAFQAGKSNGADTQTAQKTADAVKGQEGMPAGHSYPNTPAGRAQAEMDRRAMRNAGALDASSDAQTRRNRSTLSPSVLNNDGSFADKASMMPLSAQQATVAPFGRAEVDPDTKQLRGMRDDNGNLHSDAMERAKARNQGALARSDKQQADAAAGLSNSGMMSDRELNQLRSAFKPGQATGLEADATRSDALQQLQGTRSALGSAKDQQGAADNIVAGRLERTRAVQNAGVDENGNLINPDFDGHNNAFDKYGHNAELASKNGLHNGQLVTGHNGLSVLGENVNLEDLVKQGASLDALGAGELYLDPKIRERREINGAPETDDQYAARITASLHAAGLMDESGHRVDVLKDRGIDGTTAEGAQKIELIGNGKAVPELEGAVFTVPTDGMGQRFVAAADTWNRGEVEVYSHKEMLAASSAVQGDAMAYNMIQNPAENVVAFAKAPQLNASQSQVVGEALVNARLNDVDASALQTVGSAAVAGHIAGLSSAHRNDAQAMANGDFDRVGEEAARAIGEAVRNGGLVQLNTETTGHVGTALIKGELDTIDASQAKVTGEALLNGQIENVDTRLAQKAGTAMLNGELQSLDSGETRNLADALRNAQLQTGAGEMRPVYLPEAQAAFSGTSQDWESHNQRLQAASQAAASDPAQAQQHQRIMEDSMRDMERATATLASQLPSLLSNVEAKEFAQARIEAKTEVLNTNPTMSDVDIKTHVEPRYLKQAESSFGETEQKANSLLDGISDAVRGMERTSGEGDFRTVNAEAQKARNMMAELQQMMEEASEGGDDVLNGYDDILSKLQAEAMSNRSVRSGPQAIGSSAGNVQQHGALHQGSS